MRVSPDSDKASSAAIQKGYADTRFGQIHFRRAAGPGIPVILLHRTPVDSASFNRMLRLLANVRAAVAFDTPGFGQSFRPKGLPRTRDYAAWFLAAADAMGIGEFHLCAHHTGTHFAVEMTLLAPTRVRSLLLSGVLYAGPDEREVIRESIAEALTVDAAGSYLVKTWAVLRGLYTTFNADVTHSEMLGALGAIEGRNQAFSAILNQDFAAAFARVTCSIGIAQAIDDPLAPMLNRVRAARPHLPVEILGPAQTAAPELQSRQFATALLQFTAANDFNPSPGIRMNDRRYQLNKTPTGFDLDLIQAERPTPGPSQVLVKVHAASLNRRDLMIRELTYPVFDADHFTPLSDAAGEIMTIGSAVEGFAVGDRVCSTFFQHWSDGRLTFPALLSALGAGGPGVLAEHVVLAASGVAHLPDDWSFEEGASISCAGLTAWSGFNAGGGVHEDDWVLVIGTGGVALFALQIAVASGARVIVLSSSDAKLERARALGATVTINYATHSNWEVDVRQATGGGGVQHVIELGGQGTLTKSLACAAVGGHVALIGALAGFGGDISAAALIGGAIRVSAIAVGSHADHLAMMRFLVEHNIRPIIDSVFDFDSAPAAYARAAQGAFGKVLIKT